MPPPAVRRPSLIVTADAWLSPPYPFHTQTLSPLLRTHCYLRSLIPTLHSTPLPRVSVSPTLPSLHSVGRDADPRCPPGERAQWRCTPCSRRRRTSPSCQCIAPAGDALHERRHERRRIGFRARRFRRAVQLRCGRRCSVRSGWCAREGGQSLCQRAHGHRGRGRVRQTYDSRSHWGGPAATNQITLNPPSSAHCLIV